MVSFSTLFAAAPLLAIALAQKVAFTSVPASLAAGDSYNITWGSGDGTPVSLTLRRGDPNYLSTVATIADNVAESYYVWNVPTTLQAADDYALQITQGQSDINYSGLFSITGGTGANSTSTALASTTSAFSNSSMSITTPAASASGTGSTMMRNTTFSTASLSTTSASTTSGETSSTRSSSTRTSAASTQATSAPSNDAPLKAGSSAALILGIVAAVMLH
ncbi:hypothetical protein LTS08_000398 [Lithohypha guttulata]|uniref:uncharacterized protein n=1 Tax=Lithohypha guttulata TaxID=1690604 RepID=UPI002DDFEF0F|nr:hypothetical protein LTR51_006762 [Lithohypha guttulata]KAK5106280.1 hypothetical protein LTS08_000398 [Lithohypha guttulata]